METVILRTIFLYIIILVTFRLMGKREIGQLSIIDFVVSIMIAELAVISIEDPKKPMLSTIIPIALLLLIQIILAVISLKSEKIRHLLDGSPATIITNGDINEEEMKRQRYNFDDLLLQLREKNIKDLSDVEFAILETNGSLSVFKKSDHANKDGDFNDSNKNNEVHSDPSLSMPLPLILDGKVQEKHLELMNQTSLWLRQELRKIGYKDVKKIAYCAVDETGTFFVDLKN